MCQHNDSLKRILLGKFVAVPLCLVGGSQRGFALYSIYHGFLFQASQQLLSPQKVITLVLLSMEEVCCAGATITMGSWGQGTPQADSAQLWLTWERVFTRHLKYDSFLFQCCVMFPSRRVSSQPSSWLLSHLCGSKQRQCNVLGF